LAAVIGVPAVVVALAATSLPASWAGAAAASAGPSASRPPATVLIDGNRLVADRQKLARRDAQLRTELARLKKSADAVLTAGPWSVMDKKQVPPSGDRHDYYSQAPYWWPGPHGCPYEQRDGERNPDVDKISDHAGRDKAWSAIYDLTLMWYYTGDSRYARRAELDIRVWFLNSATRMNPNMRFAQVIPCDDTVRGTGIIEASESLPQVLDAFALLDSGAPGWTSADRSALRSWLGAFLNWSRTSQMGQLETAAENNHGTFKDLLDASLAVYLGQGATAADIVRGARTNRIARQIQGNGQMPLETARTRSWHYANFNVTALCRLAATGLRVGVNLWAYKAPNGGSLPKAVDYLIPTAEHGASAWPFQDIDGVNRTLPVPAFHAAAELAGDRSAKAALSKTPKPAGGDQWALVPSC
jgi:hypothetical protein